MKRSKWEDGYLLVDAVIAILILSLVLIALSGLYSRQIKAAEKKFQEAAIYLSERSTFVDELEYEF